MNRAYRLRWHRVHTENQGLPNQASLQLLVAAGGVCDLGEQGDEGLGPLELQSQQGVPRGPSMLARLKHPHQDWVQVSGDTGKVDTHFMK